jgi:cobalt-zinc-cadmium efflux system protein
LTGEHHSGHLAVSNIKTAFFLNLSFTLIEIIGGVLTNSVAIISDALHDLGDSLSLGLAWYFQRVSSKKGDKQFTYGYKRFSLLGAVINSLVLVMGSMFVLFETIPRLFKPENAVAEGMFILALLGIVVNGAAVYRLKKGKTLNEKVVSLHLWEDVLGWGAVLIGSIVMIFTELPIIDPILSVIITLYVLYNVFKNLKNSFRIFLQGVPDHINMETIKSQIIKLPGVAGVHDIHIWSLDGDYNIMTIHLIVNKNLNFPDIHHLKQRIRNLLQDVKIQHITIEVETGDETCGLECSQG